MSDLLLSTITGAASLLFLLVLVIMNDKALDYDSKLRKLNTIKITEENAKNLKLFQDNILNLVESIRADVYEHNVKESTLNTIDELRPNVYTGRLSIDSVLSNKSNSCNAHGISIELNIDRIEFKGIDDVDLIPLFSNLLDNAIEAAMLCDDKKITVTIKCINNFYTIKIVNSKPINKAPIRNNFKTSKRDEVKHGLGIKIIHGIVEKHSGEVIFNDEGNSFTVKVIIPF